MIAKPGDILLYPVTPKSSLISRVIASAQIMRREGTGTTQYSHASLVAHSIAWEMEAYFPKSRMHRIDWDRKPEVYRVKNATAEQVVIALRCAKFNLGQRYDLGRALFGFFKMAHANICTTFVARAWQEAGIDLTGGTGRFFSPNELAECGLLERV